MGCGGAAAIALGAKDANHFLTKIDLSQNAYETTIATGSQKVAASSTSIGIKFLL